FTLFYTHTTPPLSSLLPLPAALPICLYGSRIAAAPPQSPISRRYRGIAAPPSWHRACLNARSEWHHRHSRLLEGLGYAPTQLPGDRKSTRLNSSHVSISYAVFCLKKK